MIKVDARVGSAHLGPLFAELKMPFEVTTLAFGDAAFLGYGPDGPIAIGVELKLIADLIASLHSGRLVGHQLPGLLRDYQRVYVVVEGFYRANRRTGQLEMPYGKGWRPIYAGKRPIFWSDIEKFLVGLEEWGVRVHRTRTSRETARLIARVLWGYWSKDYEDHRSLDAVYVPPALSLVSEDVVTHRLRQVATCLPGIGAGRSKTVAKRFKSIYGLATADVKAWEGLEGIGSHMAGAIVQAMRAEIPAGSVPARNGSTPLRARQTRKRENRQLDTGRRDQRRVRRVAAGH